MNFEYDGKLLSDFDVAAIANRNVKTIRNNARAGWTVRQLMRLDSPPFHWADPTGKRFGNLTVIESFLNKPGVSQQVNGYLRCRCDCGVEKLIYRGNVISGKQVTCGCKRGAAIAKSRRIHGMSKTPEFRSWAGMISRCFNKNHKNYKDYGGRGVSVFQGWLHDFGAFLSHIGPKPGPGYSVDRIDNSKWYEPGNVRWASQKQQCSNKRNSRIFSYNGIVGNVGDICAVTGISPSTVKYRISRNWPVERAFGEPPRKISTK